MYNVIVLRIRLEIESILKYYSKINPLKHRAFQCFHIDKTITPFEDSIPLIYKFSLFIFNLHFSSHINILIFKRAETHPH